MRGPGGPRRKGGSLGAQQPQRGVGFTTLACFGVLMFFAGSYLSMPIPSTQNVRGTDLLRKEDVVTAEEYPLHQLNVSSLNEDPEDEEDENAEAHLLEKAELAKREAMNGAGGDLGERGAIKAVVVDELGGFLFSDGAAYESAPEIRKMSILPLTEYKRMWHLQMMHEQFFNENRHRQYIPRLAQPISKLEFHQTFRQTSTPVIIPFEYLRHLGFSTRAWTLEELQKKFPYTPPANGKLPLAYHAKSGYKSGLDLGPALYAIAQDSKLAKGSGSKRSFPRNLMLKSKYLDMLDVSRPPFLPKKRFQPPTLWFGTSTADTRIHSDCCDNFVAMIMGTKRWFIAPPTDSRHLRPIRCDGTHQSLCWASVKYPNANPLPVSDKDKLDKLQSVTLDLHAGEMLYLPAGWWHHIENLGPTVMVNFWTIGCENSAIALDADPNRSERPDLRNCPQIAQSTAEFLYSKS